MSTIAQDTFTGTNGTDLSAHSLDVGGSWTEITGFSGVIALNGSGICRNTGTTDGAYGVFTVTAVADMDVQADFIPQRGTGAAGNYGVLGRVQSGANTYYWFIYDNPNTRWAIYKVVSGSPSLLNSFSGSAPSSGNTYTIKGSLRGSTLTLFVNGTQLVTTTDSTITAAGYPGIRLFNSSGGTMANADNFLAAIPDGFTVVGPSSGLVGLYYGFAYTPGSPYTGTITPTDGGAGGTFFPSSLTWSGTNQTQYAFYKAASAAAIAINGSASPVITPTPADLTFTASSSGVAVTPASAGLAYSPGNWDGDTARAGSVYRESWRAGGYLSITFTLTGTATVNLLLINTSGGATISYLLDGVLTDNVSVPTSGVVAISGVTSGTHTLRVQLRQLLLNTGSRWTGTNAFYFSGIALPTGATVTNAAAFSGKWVLLVGDSITEGYASLGSNIGGNTPTNDSNTVCYSYLIGQSLLASGYEYGITACDGIGWDFAGGASNTDVPAYYKITGGVYDAANSSWNKMDSATSLLDSNSHISAYGSTGQEPSAIFINLGTNDAGHSVSTSDLALSVAGALAALRAAAPSAKLIVAVPFGLTSSAFNAGYPAYATAIRNAVNTYKAGDTNCTILDPSPTLCTTLASAPYVSSAPHYLAAGHAVIAPMVTQAITSAMASSGGGGGGGASGISIGRMGLGL